MIKTINAENMDIEKVEVSKVIKDITEYLSKDFDSEDPGDINYHGLKPKTLYKLLCIHMYPVDQVPPKGDEQYFLLLDGGRPILINIPNGMTVDQAVDMAVDDIIKNKKYVYGVKYDSEVLMYMEDNLNFIQTSEIESTEPEKLIDQIQIMYSIIKDLSDQLKDKEPELKEDDSIEENNEDTHDTSVIAEINRRSKIQNAYDDARVLNTKLKLKEKELYDMNIELERTKKELEEYKSNNQDKEEENNEEDVDVNDNADYRYSVLISKDNQIDFGKVISKYKAPWVSEENVFIPLYNIINNSYESKDDSTEYKKYNCEYTIPKEYYDTIEKFIDLFRETRE